MEYLPIFFDLRGRRCVVAGGGDTARRKAELLLRAGARVHVVAAAADEALHDWAGESGVMLVPRAATDADFDGCVLAVIAVEDAAEAEQAARIAARHTVAVNVVDRPQLCSCIMPAIVDRSPVIVAVSTAGAAPVLGRYLRARLEALLPARLGELAELARALRPRVSERLAPPARRRFWEGVLHGPIAELVFDGHADRARDAMLARLDRGGDPAAGEAYLVSAPPDADPEAITLRALRLLQQADVVVHDDDLPQPVLDLIRRDAARRPRPADAAAGELAAELRALATDGLRAAWLGAAGRRRAALRRRLDAAGIACIEAR